MNHRAKFDAAIALSSAEKSVTVQTQTHTVTHIQAVNNISTLCLSACVHINDFRVRIAILLELTCF